jgi:cyanophycinase-like exopeptidase
MNSNLQTMPGPIVLFGSGETSPSGQKVFDALFRLLPPNPRCALLETAAGFEPNSYQVIEKVGEFLQKSLQNYHPQIEIVRARNRSLFESPDNPAVAAPLLESDLIFLGPGSPTYAIRQLRNSLSWHYLLARHALGAALVFASAGVVAASSYALPVYEIYKAGEDLHWKDGLDLFGIFGLSLVLIPHWNNQEGGAELDTSRCYMGQERFKRLAFELPPGQTILGIDENTALMIDLRTGSGKVLGGGEAVWVHVGHRHAGSAQGDFLAASGLDEIIQKRGGHVHRYRTGKSVELSECCHFRLPVPGQGVPLEVWELAVRTAECKEAGPPQQVMELVEQRQAARQRQDWTCADALREKIECLGWKVEDGKKGVRVRRIVR